MPSFRKIMQELMCPGRAVPEIGVAFWSFLILGLLLAPVLRENYVARILIPACTSVALFFVVWWIRRNRARS